MVNSFDEAIKYHEEVAIDNESMCEYNLGCSDSQYQEWRKCAKEHRQLAEWLRELQRWREFGDWVVKAVLNDDWEENADFYAEVLCRKLTKLGKLKLVDNKYMEVNADDKK